MPPSTSGRLSSSPLVMVATEGLNISDRHLNDWAFFKPGFLYGAIPAIEADDSVSLE